jgi:hypothetical protein
MISRVRRLEACEGCFSLALASVFVFAQQSCVFFFSKPKEKTNEPSQPSQPSQPLKSLKKKCEGSPK